MKFKFLYDEKVGPTITVAAESEVDNYALQKWREENPRIAIRFVLESGVGINVGYQEIEGTVSFPKGEIG